MPRIARAFGLAASMVIGAQGVAAAAQSTVAGASGKQRALAVEASAAGVHANVCEPGEERCDAAKGALFVPPDGARDHVARAEVTAIDLVSGKRIVRVAAKVGDATWSLLLAAPADGAGKAVVVWGGWSGRPADEGGTRTDHQVVAAKGRVVVRDRRDDVSVCGRGAWVNARGIDPETLALVPDAADDPIASARGGAEVVEATNASDEASRAAPRARLLASLAGSRPGAAALVDDDAKTAWAPLGPGAGAYETATFAATPEVPIEALDVVLVPYDAESKKAAPRSFVVATPDRLVRVKLPGGTIPPEGRTYRVPFARPIAARCVALVLDPAPGGGAPAAIAELRPRTGLDAATLDAIARGLGGPDGAARAAYLVRAGKPGFDATSAAYGVLDGAGQDMARRVIDAADCSAKVPFYVASIGSRDEAVARRASDRVVRCGGDAVPALRTAIDAAPEDRLGELAEHLALASPDRAVADLLTRLGATPEATPRRLALRKALARAAQRPRARPALEAAFAADAFSALTPETRLDLVRAAAPRLAATPGGKEAFTNVAAEGAFRVRYLVAPAAAELARAGDAAARSWLERAAVADPDPRMRARAARVAIPGELDAVLARAAADAEPRVREGALAALGQAAEGGRVSDRKPRANHGEVFARGLADEWTFVREAAANAAATWPSDPKGDAALVRVAVTDPLARERRVAIRALGLRGASAAIPLVRARAADEKEDVDVRAESLGALGALCDTTSLALLTEHATKAAAPFSEVDRKLGAGAIDALGALHPPDLRERLAALVAPGAPPEAKQLARRALASPGSCARRSSF
jgi:hypothetical protein